MESAIKSAIDLANVRTSEVSAERSPAAVVSLLRKKLFDPIASDLPRAVMLGHWTQRSWDVTGEAIRQDCCLPVARVTDLQDAVTVLKALLPPADILLCSSYYDIEEIQDALLAYDGEINILVAPKGYINEHGTVKMTAWLKEKIAARHFVPKLETLSPSDGFLGQVRRASAVSGSSDPSSTGA
ncbi:hypothetical protein JCM10908_006707 [Rhodotorula pacifica]|uniref:uncharacterized protein n=1 Tax=Rhodotorula pacifica TaxID=1495444 RepID=UPI00317A2D77